ncbi:hypothetical protein Trydic_g6707 [Trypoxylus dichotomus]
MSTEIPRRKSVKPEALGKEEPSSVKDEATAKIERDAELEYDGIKVIQEFMLKAEIEESPININLSETIPISLPPLEWHHYDLPPKKMKCTNTGHTLIISAKWHQERPHISGGPLFSNYVFSQLHFHWGKNDMEGSEHRVDGSQQPLEMHVVLFKSCYLTQEAALKKKDGIVVLVYFFKLQAGRNAAIELLTEAMPYIQMPHSSARLDNLPLSFLTFAFEEDYFMYWGTVTTSECIHVLLWLISREPIGVSSEQLESFRSLLNVEEQPLQGNFRPVQDMTARRTVFHANPSYSLYSTLLPIRRAPDWQMKKANGEIKVEKDFEAAEIFNLETKQENPFKSAEKNKYTISTSIKVHPELLEKLKKPLRNGGRSADPKSGISATGDKPQQQRQADERRRRSDSAKQAITGEDSGCLFENVSAISSTTSRQSSAKRSKIPEPIKKNAAAKGRSSPIRTSHIPKRVANK